MTTSVNVSALSDDELLVFVEEGHPPACHEAAGRLREIVGVGYYRLDEIDEARDDARTTLADSLYCGFSKLLRDLIDVESGLSYERRQQVQQLLDKIESAC